MLAFRCWYNVYATTFTQAPQRQGAPTPTTSRGMTTTSPQKGNFNEEDGNGSLCRGVRRGARPGRMRTDPARIRRPDDDHLLAWLYGGRRRRAGADRRRLQRLTRRC